jgi:two-component system, chemotaxis family, protein-glutamate methylesterase/glutaminase
MARKDIVVIGGSAGAIDALRVLVGALPKDFRASIFVVVHTSPQSPGVLGEILERAGSLPAANARSGEPIRPGRIYVAPPDHHLVIEPGVVRTTRGPKENRFRPAVDPLFRSAAQVYGPRVVGVILTGGLDDGTSGLWAVKQLGGTAVVQDPADALIPSMPLSALEHVAVDHCLPLAEIAPLLVRLTAEQGAEEGGLPMRRETPEEIKEDLDVEVRIAKEDGAMEAGILKLGEPSPFACPECHGVLLRLKDGARERFRCHTGHAYSADSLLAEIRESIEVSLWSTIRAVEEGVLLMNHLAEHLPAGGDEKTSAALSAELQEARQRAEVLRRMVVSRGGAGGNGDGPPG